MAKRDWLIKPSWLGMIALIIAAYSCIAIWRGGILTYWQPGKIDIGDLLFDIFGLWWMLCLGAGVLAQRQPCTANARFWPILVISFILTALVSANLIWKAITLLQWNPQMPLTMRLGLLLGGALMPIIPTLAVWFLAKTSRRMRQVEHCFQCCYDLTGNTSGRCPECGRLTDVSPAKRFTANTRLFPELNLFETTAQRDEAWRSVRPGLLRNPQSWPGLAVLAAFLVLGIIEEWTNRPGEWSRWNTAWYVSFTALFPVTWWSHRLARRLLRQRLIEVGIPVCLHCGRDLRDESAEGCRKCGNSKPAPPSKCT